METRRMSISSKNRTIASASPIEVPPPIPAFSITGSLSPLLLVPMAFPVLVALFAPDNTLDLWTWARRFTDWVQRVVPFVRMSGHANSTTYPQAALLVHSMTLVVIPITALVWVWQSVVNYPRILARCGARGRVAIKHHLMALLVMPPLMAGILYVFVVLPGDPSFANGVTTHSRGGFAFLTFFAIYLSGATLGGQLANIRLFIDPYLKRGA
jgi:hypothetical protein